MFGSIFCKFLMKQKEYFEDRGKGRKPRLEAWEWHQNRCKMGYCYCGWSIRCRRWAACCDDKTAEYADEIDKMAERTNIGRESFKSLGMQPHNQTLSFLCWKKQLKMSETSVLAAGGSKKAAEAFEMLGISLHNTDGSMKSVNQLFEESMNALADMEESVERNYIGNQIFGRGFTEMLPLLNAGSDGIQELSDNARKLGLVMSEDAVIANVTFGDTLEDIKQSFSGVVRGLTNSFLPMMQQFADFIVANMPMIQEMLGNVFSGLGEAVTAVLPILMDMIQMPYHQ